MVLAPHYPVSSPRIAIVQGHRLYSAQQIDSSLHAGLMEHFGASFSPGTEHTCFVQYSPRLISFVAESSVFVFDFFAFCFCFVGFLFYSIGRYAALMWWSIWIWWQQHVCCPNGLLFLSEGTLLFIFISWLKHCKKQKKPKIE